MDIFSSYHFLSFFATKCDITSRADVKELIRQTIHRFGRIDILINCAGAMYYTMAYKGYTEVRNGKF